MYTSLTAQLVKNLSAMWKTWVQSLGWEDPLEKGKATHSSILAWRIPWTVESMGSQRVVREYHILKSIHLLMDIYIASTFWLLRILQLWTWVYKYRSEKNPRSGIPESYGNTIFDLFLRNCHGVFYRAILFYISISHVQGKYCILFVF